MANLKYFAECNGQAVELVNVRHDGHVKTTAEHFSGICSCGQRHIAARLIEFKSQPRRHACDARCLNATGRIMKCECSCNGKNHGRGSALVCEAA